MGAGGSEQVRWREDGRDEPGRGGPIERDSKNSDSTFDFGSRSDSGNSSSSSSRSSRATGIRSEQDKSRSDKSAASSPHDYNESYHNEYNHNEYKNIPGWEWEEGEQEEEAAEAEFEAVARLWEEMEASGKMHPLSAPVGGLRWKEEAQERFPDLARTAGVFPYMGDVIEREALDTPYDYAPPPDIDSEASAMIDKLQDLLTALRLFLPHALSPTLAAPPLNLETSKEGGGGDGGWGWEKQEEGQEEEESENGQLHEHKQQQRRWQEQQKHQEKQQQQQQQQQSQAQGEEPVDIFALGLVEEGVRVQNPVVCVRGKERWQQWLQLLGSAGGHLHLHHLYSETLVREPDRRWITALWTILLAKSGREAVAGMGLSYWWERNLPEHEAEIRRNLPADEGQEERRGVQENRKLAAKERMDKWRQGNEEEEGGISRMKRGSSSSGGREGTASGLQTEGGTTQRPTAESTETPVNQATGFDPSMMEKFFSFMSFYEQHQQAAPAQSNNSDNNNGVTPMSLDGSFFARGNH
ncbi:unnamed protein product [Closterium sp. NIES-54]